MVRPARPQIAWLILKGETIVDARSVLSVREHGKKAIYLRKAAPGLRSQSYFGGVGPAKAGNPAGGFFQHSLRRALTQASTFRIKNGTPQAAGAPSWKDHHIVTAIVKDTQNENPTTWINHQ
ncbi:MAG: hypothetical protein OEM58_11340 [Nitrospirota bacterium]|nr:hypothetical protein [Nitrospirota bacterium]